MVTSSDRLITAAAATVHRMVAAAKLVAPQSQLLDTELLPLVERWESLPTSVAHLLEEGKSTTTGRVGAGAAGAGAGAGVGVGARAIVDQLELCVGTPHAFTLQYATIPMMTWLVAVSDSPLFARTTLAGGAAVHQQLGGSTSSTKTPASAPTSTAPSPYLHDFGARATAICTEWWNLYTKIDSQQITFRTLDAVIDVVDRAALELLASTAFDSGAAVHTPHAARPPSTTSTIGSWVHWKQVEQPEWAARNDHTLENFRSLKRSFTAISSAIVAVQVLERFIRDSSSLLVKLSAIEVSLSASWETNTLQSIAGHLEAINAVDVRLLGVDPALLHAIGANGKLLQWMRESLRTVLFPL
jgi:hypothetical protein